MRHLRSQEQRTNANTEISTVWMSAALAGHLPPRAKALYHVSQDGQCLPCALFTYVIAYILFSTFQEDKKGSLFNWVLVSIPWSLNLTLNSFKEPFFFNFPMSINIHENHFHICKRNLSPSWSGRRRGLFIFSRHSSLHVFFKVFYYVEMFIS